MEDLFKTLGEITKPKPSCLGDVSKSVRIEAIENAIKKETDFQSKWHLQEILRITKYGLPKDAPYIPMMP